METTRQTIDQIDVGTIQQAWNALTLPGEIREISVFKDGPNRIGYFDNVADVIDELEAVELTWDAVYLTVNATPNKLCTNCFSPTFNRTGNGDIQNYSWLFIDIDVERETKSSSTDSEKDAALERIYQVIAFMHSLGFPDPILNDSGNGFHAFYRVDLPTSERPLVKKCLAALDQRFPKQDGVHVDQKVKDPSRLTKLPGTMVRKGPNVTERPHRMAGIISVPDVLPVSKRLLDSLASKYVEPKTIRQSTKESGCSEIELARSALAGLSPKRCDDYGEWIRIGMSLHSVSDEMFEDWNQWSTSSDAYDGRNMENKWKSFEGTSVTIGTLIHCAIEDGWAYPKAEKPKATTKRKKRVDSYEGFPTDALPEPLKSVVREGSKEIGCDASYIALPALSVCASLIGNSVCAQVKRNWFEPSVLWTAVVGYSGDKKSPAHKIATAPLYAIQEDAFKLATEQRKEFEKEELFHQVAMKKWKSKGDGDPPEKPELPPVERCLVSDTTMEALSQILKQNPNGIMVCRDELDAWFGSFDRYSGGKGSDVPNWLSTHGAGSIIVDRKSEGAKTTYVKRSAISIYGGIQPAVLRKAMKGTTMACSGLIPRFLFAMPPRRKAGWTDYEMDDSVLKKYVDLLYELRNLKSNAIKDGEITPTCKQLTPTAKNAFIEHVNSIAEIQSQAGDVESSALSKLEGGAARLALVIQCVEDPFGPITESAMQRGVLLTNWFMQEARRIAGVAAEDDSDEEIRRLAEWIRDGKFQGVITASELNRYRRDIADTDEARTILRELTSAGYGTFGVEATGGRPGEVFRLTT